MIARERIQAATKRTSGKSKVLAWCYRLWGWVLLTFDTLAQRLINWNAQGSIPLFQQPKSVPSNPEFASDGVLCGKTAIVTGANTGLGLETARWLAASGATVVLACRSLEKAALARSNILQTHPSASIETIALDLSNLDSVRAFAHSFMFEKPQSTDCSEKGDGLVHNDQLTSIRDTNAVADNGTPHRTGTDGVGMSPRPLHMLILNAGVMCLPLSRPEVHFQVNHLAHALVALLLLPSLVAVAGDHARIVFVSSLSFVVSDLRLDDLDYERRPYSSFQAYANSKLCNILFNRALSARLRALGIKCFVVHPGESATDVARNLGKTWFGLHKRFGPLFLLSPAEASRTAVFAAAAPNADAATDEYFHAVCSTRRIPRRFLSHDDTELLWEITVSKMGLSKDERQVLRNLDVDLEPRWHLKHFFYREGK